MQGHSTVQHDDDDAALLPVSITISIVAVLLALVSLLAHRAHTRSILAQNRLNDAWVHYQSAALALNSHDALLDLLSFTQLKDPTGAEKVKAKYQQKIDQASRQQNEMEARAETLETEVEHRETAADRFDLSDVFLEAAIVFISMTLLTKRRLYSGIGIAFACIGLIVAGAGLFIS